MGLAEQGQKLKRMLEVLEGQKCKLIYQVWKIESEQEALREKMRKIGYTAAFEVNELPETLIKKNEK